MLRAIFISLAAFTVMTLSACSDQEPAAEKADYDTTKKMVLDILQTEEGEKALQELMADEKMKQQLVIQDDSVKEAVNKALVSDEGKKVWETLFDDPDFVENYAKSMAKQHKKVMKELMNDSEYQKQMLELFKNPEMKEEMLSVMKSRQFRSHLEDTVQETLETPLFQSKMKETLLKAAEEQEEQEEDNDEEDDESENEQDNQEEDEDEDEDG